MLLIILTSIGSVATYLLFGFDFAVIASLTVIIILLAAIYDKVRN